MSEHGKKYEEAVKLLDKEKAYTTEEAAALAKKMHYTKFDETVNLSLRMGVDPRNANQQVRGVAVLPNGLGNRLESSFLPRAMLRSPPRRPALILPAWMTSSRRSRVAGPILMSRWRLRI